jgi:hypothetical protein
MLLQILALIFYPGPNCSKSLLSLTKTLHFDRDANLNPLESLVRFGKNANKVNVTPYYQRCGGSV